MCRGEAVNQDDLYKALSEHVIAGAGLDVMQFSSIDLNYIQLD